MALLAYANIHSDEFDLTKVPTVILVRMGESVSAKTCLNAQCEGHVSGT